MADAGGGGGRPSSGSAAAPLGQKLSAITVAAVPSGAPSRRPLPLCALPGLGAPGVRPAAGGPALRASGAGCSRERGRAPGRFDVGGREEPSAWREGGRAAQGVARPPGEPRVPPEQERERPAGWRTFPPPPVIVRALPVRGRRNRRAPGGPGGGKSGRALRVLREKFPTAGHRKVNFSPAIELVLFPQPWGDRFKKEREPPSNLFLSLFGATALVKSDFKLHKATCVYYL